jgi:uncharacterized YccA/Bax inhibitor family protein
MANPVLTKQWGQPAEAGTDAALQQAAPPPIIIQPGEEPMTIGHVLRVTTFLFVLLVAAAAYGWTSIESIGTVFWVVMIAVIVLMIATIAKPQWVRVTAPLYAIAEGVLIGAISRIYEDFYDGIVLQAVLATIAVFLAMLFLYATRIIRVTARLRSTIILATVGIALFYLISIVLNLFGVQIPFVWESGWVGIVVSLLIVGVAAFNLLLDFDLIENGIRQSAPGWMSWFAAFGLMVTVIWLYLEMLRLLALVRGRS